jgi:hypothetical protein
MEVNVKRQIHAMGLLVAPMLSLPRGGHGENVLSLLTSFKGLHPPVMQTLIWSLNLAKGSLHTLSYIVVTD